MSRVILQPAGDPAARQHYSDTIETPVPRATLEQHLESSDLSELDRNYSGSAVPTWGVTPGEGEGNRRKWERVEPGDVALVARGGRIFATGIVTHKAHNPALASALWGTDDDGDTWEYIYFLDEIRDEDIPYSAFNEAAGYEPGNIIQGFNVLSEEKSETIIAAFGLASATYQQPVSKDTYEQLAKQPLDPEQPLDGVTLVKVRKEQSFLRNALFGGAKTSKCAFCGGTVPIDLLVAAHVKKRSVCSPEERLDYKNIVIPLCTLGCDALFERGYLTVQEGKLAAHIDENLPTHLKEHLATLQGQTCVAWTPNTSGYFKWHYQVTFRG